MYCIFLFFNWFSKMLIKLWDVRIIFCRIVLNIVNFRLRKEIGWVVKISKRCMIVSESLEERRKIFVWEKIVKWVDDDKVLKLVVLKRWIMKRVNRIIWVVLFNFIYFFFRMVLFFMVCIWGVFFKLLFKF